MSLLQTSCLRNSNHNKLSLLLPVNIIMDLFYKRVLILGAIRKKKQQHCHLGFMPLTIVIAVLLYWNRGKLW